MHEVDFYTEVAQQLWLKRNNFVHGGNFLHPNKLILVAKNHVAQEPVTLVNEAEDTGAISEDIVWKSPPTGTYKANWDVTIDFF
jgi:hypothetical protein